MLTLQYERTIYLLPDTPATRRLIHRYIDIYEYPDGCIEIRADGQVLPYVPYDRLSEIVQGAIVDNKRLAHVLRVAQIIQQQRDSPRAGPAHTNAGLTPRPKQALVGTKPQRQLNAQDVARAIELAHH